MSELPEKELWSYIFNENVYRYRKGGYHPVDIGDVFKNRYLVHNKLAYASTCMVWLVEDLLLKRFASLKDLTAARSAESSEKYVVEHLKVQQEQFHTHPGKEHVMQTYDAFTVDGPNGTLICIVAELLGISLAEEKEAIGILHKDTKHYFPDNVNKKVAGQVALGLAYLHKCGIIHGDLHFKNILFVPELQNSTRNQIKKLFGKPKRVPILYKDGSSARSDHRPRNVYYTDFSVRLFELCFLPNAKIHVKICDFGESTIYDPRRDTALPTNFNMLPAVKAPEIIFKDISAPTFSMDIWSLGVVLYMIMDLNVAPFSNSDLEMMVESLGKFPKKWWTQWTDREQYFDNNGVHCELGVEAGTGWDRKWMHSRRLPKEEITAFSDMLWKTFRYEPEERIDADEVVRLIPDSWKQGGRTPRNSLAAARTSPTARQMT